MSRILVFAAGFEIPAGCTPPISDGTTSACRIFGDCAPVIHDDTGVDAPFICAEYATLAAAMAAYPDLPWHSLGIFGGEDAEPELIAAQAEHDAMITTSAAAIP